MKELIIEDFPNGLITSVESKTIKRGSSSELLNWEHLDDHIELRRGMKLIGEDAGIGRVTGLHTSREIDGTPQTWRTRGKKLELYVESSDTWVEVGTDELGDDADGEDVSFGEYATIQGYMTWLSSPNSSLYKLMTSNPDSLIDMYNEDRNFKGYIKILLNRMFLFNQKTDKQGIYLSHIDNLANTQVNDEAIGALGSTNYTGTLAFKAGGSTRHCFAVAFTDGTETFNDNYDGTLTGNAGGTGTINYATGEYDITFNAVTTGAVTADYQWEDSNVNGISDFTKSATRLAGEGATFRQDVGGDAKSVLAFNDVLYCMHEFNTWRLNIGLDDTEATNLIFRELAGITNWRAAVSTGSGIFFIDDSNESDPQFKVLRVEGGNPEVVPATISKDLNLSNYRFDKGACTMHGDTVRFACRTSDSTTNNREFVYNFRFKSWYVTDYFVSCYATRDGALWAGDSVTNNVYEILSGFDDDDSTIDNVWISKLDDLDARRLKKAKKLILQGLIQRDQKMDVYYYTDNNDFIKIATIEGDASYVDSGIPVSVGNNTIGKKTVGGGDEAVAFNYKTEIKINTDKFEKIKIMFKATGIGFISVGLYHFKDIRYKEQRLASKYR